MQCRWYYDTVAAAVLQLCHACSACARSIPLSQLAAPAECPPQAKAMAGKMARTTS